MPSYKRTKRCTLGPLGGWGEKNRGRVAEKGPVFPFEELEQVVKWMECPEHSPVVEVPSMPPPTQSVWKEGKMEGRGRGRAQRGWASYSHHQMIVLFLLLKPHPGIPTQFSTCSISLILWDSARNLFFHKIPVTSWNIQLSLSSLNTYLMNMWIVLHRLAQHRADTLFKKLILAS